MIWHAHNSGDHAADAVVEQIIAEVSCLCGDALDGTGITVEEIARAVERFLGEQGQDPSVSSDYIVMLTSQALSTLGEDQAARRLVVFGTGLVRPSEWEATGKEAVWVLDLKRMTLRSDSCLELVFFNGLRAVIESMADVWDGSNGSGVLGLRHVSSAAAALVGGNARGWAAAGMADEIKGICTDKLASIACRRGWLEVPLVMDLDV